MAKKREKEKMDAIPVISVTVEEGQVKETFRFSKTFCIGRADDCEIQITNPAISRHHAEVYFSDGKWHIRDLGSGNGIYLEGVRQESIPLEKETRLELGMGDAILHLFPGQERKEQMEAGPTVLQQPPSMTQFVHHYFDEEAGEEGGARTRQIRRAYKVVQKKQRKKYFIAIAIVLLIAVVLGGFSYYQHQEVKKQKQLARQIFYTMKSIELELSQMEENARQHQDEQKLQKIDKTRGQQKNLLSNYNDLLQELNFYESSEWSDEDRVIIRVARAFGECELGMPREFLDEVHAYIGKWRTTQRLQQAVRRARDKKYNRIVYNTMLEHHMPPQFFYLALQESDFIIETIGPKTRFGIAKGVWQFIPPTARRYGLRTGPLVGLRRYDPRDDRFNVKKATEAAARYIKDIYNTEAQASGLLVIASYNWGENNIRGLLRQMPANPRDRNFWNLLTKYRSRIPKQTYDYVFYIISAAVIGEEPALFGFDFKNPLAAATAEPGAAG